MSLSWTSEVVKTSLQKINSLGVYTLPIFQWLAPAFGRLIFGDEQFGIGVSSKVNVRDILVDVTTSEDGRTITWRNVAYQAISTQVNGAVSAATAVVVDDITGFSKWDAVKIRNKSTNVDTIAYVTDINTGSKTLTMSANVTCDDNSYITRLSYSKTKGSAIDRLDYDPTSKRYENYFQDFGATLELTLDQINSHYAINVSNMSPNPQQALKSQQVVQDAVANYIKMKVAQKIWIEIIGDIARQFYDGEKKLVGSRYYAAGLRDVETVVTIDASGSSEQMFEDIRSQVLKVKHRSFSAWNRKVVMVANHSFIEKFSTLAAGKVTFTDIPNEYGYDLTMIKLPWNNGSIELMYEPQLDTLEFLDTATAELPICHILPLDLISAKTRKWIDVDNVKDAKRAMGGFDVKIKKGVTSEDTGDTFTYYFFYRMTFVFGWNDLPIYTKLVIA